MKITYKEAAEILEKALMAWNEITMFPERLEAGADHNHDIYSEAMWAINQLAKMDGEFPDPME